MVIPALGIPTLGVSARLAALSIKPLVKMKEPRSGGSLSIVQATLGMAPHARHFALP